MSKSLGNYVGVNEPPQAMYHKLYALPDALVESYFQLLTDVPLEAVQAKVADVAAGRLNPNALKEELAREIVAQYHGAEAAEKAAAQERKIHAGEAVPEDIPVLTVAAGEHWIPELIVKAGLAKSNGEGRRLIENGGVSFDEAKVSDPKAKAAIAGTHLLRCGKRSFVRIVAG
jgi:tyrosyl-tRNA synthetase